jgi:hypothetical protein
MPEHLPLPHVYEPPDPRPRPDRRRAVAVERKPPERQIAAEHPRQVKSA